MIHLDIPKMTQKRETKKKDEGFITFRTTETQSMVEETLNKERIQVTREIVMKAE